MTVDEAIHDVTRSLPVTLVERRVGRVLAAEIARLRVIVDAIDELRADECSSVEIFNDNPVFGGPEAVVKVAGDWTGTNSRSLVFYGENVGDCLQTAVAAKREAEVKP
jgi:hypothetical protein